MKVRTQAVHFAADQKLVDFIEKKVNKLEQFFNRMLGAEVILKLENSGQIRDKVAEIILNVPGDTLIAKDTHKSFEGAVDGATESLRRQLLKYKERIQSKRIS